MRASEQLGVLRLDRRMNEMAGAYTRQMARSSTLGHGSWSQRVARSASAPSHVGEVIGWLVPGTARAEAAAVVRSWLASPVHRQVLLDGGFRRIGIGRAVGALGGASSAIYTVDFASAR